MSQYGVRIRQILEILVSIDFTRFDLENQGYFSRQTADAKEVGSTIELYCREIQNIMNSSTNQSVYSFGHASLLAELQQIWNQYQPRMNVIQRTRQYKNYVEYLDNRYWPEYDCRTFSFIESILNEFLVIARRSLGYLNNESIGYTGTSGYTSYTGSSGYTGYTGSSGYTGSNSILHTDTIEMEEDNEEDEYAELFSDAPSDMLCPITCAIMKEPVICSDGNTYERKAIETWLRTNNKSPSTNLPLANKVLIPNVFAKKVIDAYKETKLKEKREYDML
jgi:hypothetical protein